MLNRPCTWTKGGDIINELVQGQRLEELGIAVYLSRGYGSRVKLLQGVPFDAQFENEEHTELKVDEAAEDDG